jgi:NAD(P)-dependent dehydrogenase (short-subunit alcohol dehydrogenase family)
MKQFYANKVAVVTGGASGIGLAMTEWMLGFGTRVVIADLNETKLREEGARLAEQYPGRIYGKKTDVCRVEEVNALVDYAVEQCGRLDLMFNNAGVGLLKPIDQITAEDWKYAFDVNFYGALYGTLAARRVMKALGGGGHIANTASGIVFSPMPLQAMYSATKAALHAVTLALRAEIWEENIFLHSVIPGTVATPIFEGHPPEGAIAPEESARTILEKVKDNMRIVFVTEQDMQGAKYNNHPDMQPDIDEYFNRVAAARKAGILNAF